MQISSKLAATLTVMQARIVSDTSYCGIKTMKNPLDFWVYQELIWDLKPDVVVEVGNLHGGSAAALADFMIKCGGGDVIAVDIDHSRIHDLARSRSNIDWIEGDATSLFPEVQERVGNRTCLVIEDSLHSYENTLSVLKHYSQLVSEGSYMIVEDTICHHGLDVGPNPGPFEAVETFLQQTEVFEVDASRESWGITWNPSGYLRRIG